MVSQYLDPKNDFAFKRIFGREKNKDILIGFLNDVLDHKHVGQIVDVAFLDPVQNPDVAAKKQSILDVLCRDQNGVQYIVEMQVAKTTGFEKRAQYYASKAYIDQLGKAEGYENLKEVIFLAITDFVMFPKKKAVKSDHMVLDRETSEHDLKDLFFTFIELPKFTKGIDELSSMTEKWYYYLKHASETQGEVYEKLIVDAPIIKRAYKELNRANWSKEELRAYERVEKIERDNAAAEAYKLEKAQEKGKKEGRKEGKKEGIAIGEKKGITMGEEKKQKEIALQMLAKGLATELICELTGLTPKQVNALKPPQ